METSGLDPLVASSTSTAVAAMTVSEPGHLGATGSNSLERCSWPQNWPYFLGENSQCYSALRSIEGLLRSGIPRAGVLVRDVLI